MKAGAIDHVRERMKQRLHRDMTDDEYTGLCGLTRTKGYAVAIQPSGIGQYVVRFKRKWMTVVYDRNKDLVLTCWRCAPKLIAAARVVVAGGSV